LGLEKQDLDLAGLLELLKRNLWMELEGFLTFWV
jgi:hypothetical protein